MAYHRFKILCCIAQFDPQTITVEPAKGVTMKELGRLLPFVWIPRVHAIPFALLVRFPMWAHVLPSPTKQELRYGYTNIVGR